jgi:TPR repeat protein
LELLKKAAETGDTEAQVALATVYLKGEETPRDPSRAEALLRQAVQNGHAGAALQLGHRYSGKYGAGPEVVNFKEATVWYTKAAEAGDAEAQYALGMLHLNGNVEAADSAVAISWIERAANNDHTASLFQLGVMYGTGTAVRRDAQRALGWYELAAQLGHPLAQYNLAAMLAKGEGCEPDRGQAQSWLRKAAEQGLPAAEAALRGMNGSGGAIVPSMDRAAGRPQKNDAAMTAAPALPTPSG